MKQVRYFAEMERSEALVKLRSKFPACHYEYPPPTSRPPPNTHAHLNYNYSRRHDNRRPCSKGFNFHVQDVGMSQHVLTYQLPCVATALRLHHPSYSMNTSHDTTFLPRSMPQKNALRRMPIYGIATCALSCVVLIDTRRPEFV